MDILAGVDPEPVEIVNSQATAPLLIVAEHAGRGVPRRLDWTDGPLGLPRDAFDLHIACDLGVTGVARRLSTLLNATAVLTTYTRLLIDPNRALGDADCIPPVSDGHVIPANQQLSDEDCQARADAFYWPYHCAVDGQLARLKRAGRVPLLVSIHSFTPMLRSGGAPRPWHIGVMASRDTRLADALIPALRELGFRVGFNEPYSGVTHGYSMKVHGLAHGLPHAQLEIRQDLLDTDAAQADWAGSVASVLSVLVADATLQTVKHW